MGSFPLDIGTDGSLSWFGERPQDQDSGAGGRDWVICTSLLCMRTPHPADLGHRSAGEGGEELAAPGRASASLLPVHLHGTGCDGCHGAGALFGDMELGGPLGAFSWLLCVWGWVETPPRPMSHPKGTRQGRSLGTDYSLGLGMPPPRSSGHSGPTPFTLGLTGAGDIWARKRGHSREAGVYPEATTW